MLTLTRSENKPNPMLPTVLRVRESLRETHDTFTLILESPQAQPFRFAPGQFNMLYVFGVGEAAISLSGDPSQDGSIAHTIRAVGSVTDALKKLKPGDAVGVRGPFGSSWPLEQARGQDVVLVSGGIGLAPLRPVIYHLLKNRADYGRVALLQGARTPADLLYAEELAAWPKRHDIQVSLTVDQPDAGWKGRVGVVTTLFRQLEFDPSRTVGMMCGPEVMMRFTMREFAKRGVAEERMYLSLERNMQCAVGFCGHCQFGPSFVCMDGPVFRFDRVKNFFEVREA